MADASSYAAVYVLMIEDYKTNENNQELKVDAPVNFGSRILHPNQLKLSIYAKEFFTVQFALDTFANFIWGCIKPVLILTDNRSVTRFFQTKIIPPTLWNALDHVLSFDINSRSPMHENEINTAADTPDNSISYPSSSEDDNTPKIMKRYLLESKQTSGEDPMNVKADVQLQILAPATQQINAMHEQNPLAELITDGHGPLDLRAEHQQDKDIKRVLLWFERGSPTTGQYLSSDLKKYLKQFPRLSITEGVLHRKFYNHLGYQFVKQYCVPSRLQKEVL